MVDKIKADKSFQGGLSGEEFIQCSLDLFLEHMDEVYGKGNKMFLRSDYMGYAHGLSLAVRIIEGKIRILEDEEKGKEEMIEALEKLRFGVVAMWGTLIQEAVKIDEKIKTTG
jgi:hypothetical protein